jgi:hypothetical protein
MQATKYKDLVVLLILLDQVESRSRELAERYPELGVMAEADDARGNGELTGGRLLLQTMSMRVIDSVNSANTLLLLPTDKCDRCFMEFLYR